MSKQKRKQAAKRRNRERAARAARGGSTEPGIVSVLLDGLNRFGPYLALSDDPDVVVAQARAGLVAAVEAIEAATVGVDVFDVLEVVRLENSLVDPETFRESEHGGTVTEIELIALILAARGGRAGRGPTDGVEPGPGEVLGVIRAQMPGLVAAGQVLVMFSGDRQDPLHRVSFGARLREVAVRNAAYPHMVDDTLGALFDEAEVEAACRSGLGCTVGQIRQVFTALQQCTVDSWTSRTDALRELAQLADRAGDEITDLTPADRARAQCLLSHATVRPGAAAAHTPEMIATAAGLDVTTVGTVLALFSTPMRVRPPIEAVLEFFEGKSPWRTHPIIATPEDEYVVVHHALLIPAIRERVEDALRADRAAWDLYSKHRGDHLEAEAARLLAGHLPGCVQHLGLEYFVPADDTETVPSAYTKLVEGDGLLILDDIAVIIEAKAVALRARSRTGDPLRLRQDLRRIVTEAADQCDRFRRRIISDRGIRLRDNTWLDLRAIREIHSVAVSLEDLSGIATVTSDLVVSGLLTTDELPWTVSLHDLRVISELIDRPAELLLYLRRRTEPGTTRRFHAVDELDFFLHFFAAQLYVEPDPDRVHQELPQLGPPTTKARRRFRRQGLEMLTSRTDPLDAWYLHQRGIRTTPAEKPCMHADPDLLHLVDDLTQRREPGWLAMTATLLGFDTASQRRCASSGPRLAAQTSSDGLSHSLAMPAGTRRGDSVLLTWMTTTSSPSFATWQRRLQDYTTAKKHQLQLNRALGLLYNHLGQLLSTHYDNRPPGPNPSLDKLCAQIPLKGPEAFQNSPPPTRRPRRRP